MRRRCRAPCRGSWSRGRSNRWALISASTDPPRVALLDALAAPDSALSDDLRAALRERTRAWATALGGGVPPLEVRDVATLRSVLGAWTGAVVVVAPDIPTLGPHHADAIRDDLAAGVLLSSAATGDGTPYLIALSTAEPELLDLVGASFNDLVAAANARDRELGMVRAERRLTTANDVLALKVDPLTPPELRALLD